MASESLVFDQDILTEWVLYGGGSTHWGNLNSQNFRRIRALTDNAIDRIGLTAPAGAVSSLTSLDIHVYYFQVVAGAGDSPQVYFYVENGAGDVLGFVGSGALNDGFLEEADYSIPLSGDASDAADLRLRLFATASIWAPLNTAIDIDWIAPTLVYSSVVPPEPAGRVTLRRERNLEAPVKLEQRAARLPLDRDLVAPARIRQRSARLEADRIIVNPVHITKEA